MENENIELEEDIVGVEDVKEYHNIRDGIIKNNGYNKFAPLMPGTIICSSYHTFDGEERVGIFCVIYDETIDNNIFDSRNVIAFKISSQNTLVSNYSCGINRNVNQYLDKECIVCCSKMHVLHKSKNIYKVLGQLDRNTYARVVKTHLRFRREIERQMFDRL